MLSKAYDAGRTRQKEQKKIERKARKELRSSIKAVLKESLLKFLRSDGDQELESLLEDMGKGKKYQCGFNPFPNKVTDFDETIWIDLERLTGDSKYRNLIVGYPRDDGVEGCYLGINKCNWSDWF